jgi:putative sugar O-methyltransferase
MHSQLRAVSKRLLVRSQECLGIAVMTRRARDQLLADAPHLRPHFLLPMHARSPAGSLPKSCHDELRMDHPQLQELRRRYANHPASEHIQWSLDDLAGRLDLRYFRADNLYVYQSRAYTPMAFYATAAYAKEIDGLGIFEALKEDDYFGAETFDFHGKTVSRDLLDSVMEINFLNNYLPFGRGAASVNVLDIGAGYGRLAHRMATACGNVGTYICTDAVPESTFVSRYYLNFRRMSDRCAVVPLDALGELRSMPIELAVNVHSFTECRGCVVRWWVDQVRDMSIPWLFIETAFGLTSREGYAAREDFGEVIEQSGYRLVAQQPKFARSTVMQKQGLYPSEFFLFHRGAG